MPIDYSKGKIYKLTTIHNPDLVYYGSTTNSLYKRKGSHKSSFKCKNKVCSSIKLFELGIDDVEITLVESVICNNKEELHKRERFYIENNNCVNKVIPTRDYKEYYKQNKNKIKEYQEQNKDKIKEYNKQYMKDYKKKYDELNKDKIKEYGKQYYLSKKSNLPNNNG